MPNWSEVETSWLKDTSVKWNVAVSKAAGNRNYFSLTSFLRSTVKEENLKMTRSSLLQKIAVAPIVVGALAALATEAEAKAPPSAVMYQDKPKDGKKCSQCKFFIANKKSSKAKGGCTQVSGAISPEGWCVVYSPGANKQNK